MKILRMILLITIKKIYYRYIGSFLGDQNSFFEGSKLVFGGSKLVFGGSKLVFGGSKLVFRLYIG
ncbi:hypothetical protein CWM47_36065 [Spirosoma pollinicola]|uniref:Uncharacterized protein n=1 Tax=Spirosoma pollinicola TaxID=2057025 RepID=A0A2K8ZA90_9BACT|nr:hypothetical protein CWM47_36065 [Spirosoma pollinicola]